jgi:hypothetical protein
MLAVFQPTIQWCWPNRVPGNTVLWLRAVAVARMPIDGVTPLKSLEGRLPASVLEAFWTNQFLRAKGFWQ